MTEQTDPRETAQDRTSGPQDAQKAQDDPRALRRLRAPRKEHTRAPGPPRTTPRMPRRLPSCGSCARRQLPGAQRPARHGRKRTGSEPKSPLCRMLS